MRGLRAKTAITFVLIASGIVWLATRILIWEIHYHFNMYQQSAPNQPQQISFLSQHVEQALVQSIAWTALGATLLAIIVSFFVANRITAPLIKMKRAAEQMTDGRSEARVQVGGNDEVADLGRALNHLASQLQTQEQLRKNMTSDIAHELRTPLTTLKSHLEAFLDGVWEPTPQRIKNCYEEIERLAVLVGDLEQLTQFESPGFALTMGEEDLCEIVSQAVQSNQALYHQKGVQIESIGCEKPVTVMVDRVRFMQVLVNLLSNALKYTPEGGRVSVLVEEKVEKVFLSVRDTGIGIPRKELPLVFERFYRTEKSRSRLTGGSGLGLTITKRLLEAHGGTVRIQSEEGIGTEVMIQLPKGV